jgi:hypothetical protein
MFGREATAALTTPGERGNRKSVDFQVTGNRTNQELASELWVAGKKVRLRTLL